MTAAAGGSSEARPTRDGYGAGLVRVGELYPNSVALDADLAESTRSQWFQKRWPERFFQMGISEQDMIGTACGLAACGKIAFASTFAIFTERAFEQIRTSVARQDLDVKIAGSHGGIMTGEDGSSAHAIEDVAIYRVLPNFAVLVPADASEAEAAVLAVAARKGPSYMKLTRAKVPALHDQSYRFEIGRGETLCDGSDVAIVACGPLVAEAVAAHDILRGEGVSARVVNMASVKPLDRALVAKAGRECGAVVTAEDHNVIGGLGSAVAECLSEEAPARLVRVGIPDRFAESGSPRDLYEKYGLTARHLAEAARRARAKLR
ncbi:MAG: transketolase family protein [Methanobacteriota archaeon]